MLVGMLVSPSRGSSYIVRSCCGFLFWLWLADGAGFHGAKVAATAVIWATPMRLAGLGVTAWACV